MKFYYTISYRSVSKKLIKLIRVASPLMTTITHWRSALLKPHWARPLFGAAGLTEVLELLLSVKVGFTIVAELNFELGRHGPPGNDTKD